MNELQELSRDAARKLPDGFQLDDLYICYDGESAGMIALEDGSFWWLHESTEACAEIMVRVLWPKEIYLQGYVSDGETLVGMFNDNQKTEEGCFGTESDTDPTQAFRTAVLRAVVAL